MFPVQEGDTVRWWTREGFANGRFVRWSRKGKPVVIPAGNRSEKYVDRIYPVNDGRMVAKRGRVTMSGYNDTTTTTRRKRGGR